MRTPSGETWQVRYRPGEKRHVPGLFDRDLSQVFGMRAVAWIFFLGAAAAYVFLVLFLVVARAAYVQASLALLPFVLVVAYLGVRFWRGWWVVHATRTGDWWSDETDTWRELGWRAARRRASDVRAMISTGADPTQA